MKHYTHVYLANKAVEFLWDSVDNLSYKSGSLARSSVRRRVKKGAADLQRILGSHMDRIEEASWAPDDILYDMKTFHIYKLMMANEFTDYQGFVAEEFKVGGKTYYKVKGGGGLPYKIDHLARLLADMVKLRAYNDIFTMEHICYLFFLLSHYIADANVPMHTDVRDDKPSRKKPQNGNYYSTKWHGKIEKLWEKGSTPIALRENIIPSERKGCNSVDTNMTPFLKFYLKPNVKDIHTTYVKPNQLIKYMQTVCAHSKDRSVILFPVSNPDNFNEATLEGMSHDIFADAIGSIISVWLAIWDHAFADD